MSKTVSFRPSKEVKEKLKKMADKKKWSVSFLVNELITEVLTVTKKQ